MSSTGPAEAVARPGVCATAACGMTKAPATTAPRSRRVSAGVQPLPDMQLSYRSIYQRHVRARSTAHSCYASSCFAHSLHTMESNTANKRWRRLQVGLWILAALLTAVAAVTLIVWRAPLWVA